MKQFLLVASLSLFAAKNASFSQCTSIGSSLATSYTSNNGSRGAMFNITATNTITIHCFDANLYGGTTAKYEIYYKSGTYVGSETNSAAWTLAGSVNSLYSAANNVATAIPISVNVVIPAGQTYGFYVTNTASGGLNYTSSAVTNVTLATDANLNVVGGVGKAYPFSSTYSYRLFNGTVHYSVGNVLPIDFVQFTATLKNDQTVLEWSTLSENNNDYFEIDRTQDGENWERVATVNAVGNSTTQNNYVQIDKAPLTGTTYYRLSQTDLNGKYTILDTKALNYIPSSAVQGIDFYPNPATNQVSVLGSLDELEGFSVYNSSGQDVTNLVHPIFGEGKIDLDVSDVNSSFFLIKTNSATSVLVKN